SPLMMSVRDLNRRSRMPSDSALVLGRGVSSVSSSGSTSGERRSKGAGSCSFQCFMLLSLSVFFDCGFIFVGACLAGDPLVACEAGSYTHRPGLPDIDATFATGPEVSRS